jgi:hypothetical protein
VQFHSSGASSSPRFQSASRRVTSPVSSMRRARVLRVATALSVSSSEVSHSRRNSSASISPGNHSSAWLSSAMAALCLPAFAWARANSSSQRRASSFSSRLCRISAARNWRSTAPGASSTPRAQPVHRGAYPPRRAGFRPFPAIPPRLHPAARIRRAVRRSSGGFRYLQAGWRESRG